MAVAPETAEVVVEALATNVEIEALVRRWLQNSLDSKLAQARYRIFPAPIARGSL